MAGEWRLNDYRRLVFKQKSLSLKYSQVTNDTWYQYRQYVCLLIVQTILSPGPFLTAGLLMHAFSSFYASNVFLAPTRLLLVRPWKCRLVTKCIDYHYYFLFYRQILQVIGLKDTWCHTNWVYQSRKSIGPAVEYWGWWEFWIASSNEVQREINIASLCQLYSKKT